MTFEIGFAPQGVQLMIDDALSRAQNIAHKRLFVHIENDHAHLQADEVRIELPPWRECEVHVLWMFPAKGAGFSEVSLFDPQTQKFLARLLDGQFANLDWMKGAAVRLAAGLELVLVEHNLGGDA